MTSLSRFPVALSVLFSLAVGGALFFEMRQVSLSIAKEDAASDAKVLVSSLNHVNRYYKKNIEHGPSPTADDFSMGLSRYYSQKNDDMDIYFRGMKTIEAVDALTDFDRDAKDYFTNNRNDHYSWYDKERKIFNYAIPVLGSTFCVDCDGAMSQRKNVGDLAGFYSVSLPIESKRIEVSHHLIKGFMMTITFMMTLLFFMYAILHGFRQAHSMGWGLSEIRNKSLRELFDELKKRKNNESRLVNINKTLEERICEQHQEIDKQTTSKDQMAFDIKAMRKQMVNMERMASIGELAAGIAHEIKNPLNFIGNFSSLSYEMSSDLFDQMKEMLSEKQMKEMEPLIADIKCNNEKVAEHSARADSIVKNMLKYSRGVSEGPEATNMNDLLKEYVNLTYHGMRANHSDFNVKIEEDYQDNLSTISCYSQEIGRVFVNIVNNAMYATREKAMQMEGDYAPVVRISTRAREDGVEIRIRDNGLGIPQPIKDKIFTPFFTTKPSDEGTGLGLAICHEIIVDHHGGSIEINSEVGEYSEFVIVLKGVDPK